MSTPDARDVLAERLRATCAKLRTTPVSLKDFIPLLQQAADALAAPVDAPDAKDAAIADGAAPAPELLVWEFTGIAGLKRFLTQAQYEAQTHDTQKWYRPICPKCGPLGVQPSEETKEKNHG